MLRFGGGGRRRVEGMIWGEELGSMVGYEAGSTCFVLLRIGKAGGALGFLGGAVFGAGS